jgi:RNA polymerase sigma-70 factor, ECF subfamily
MPLELNEPDTEELLERVAQGDDEALQQLLLLHRTRLRQMIDVRLDARLAARFDASDVVQETLKEALQKLPRYLVERPLPFYPWLRQIGWKRLERLFQQHLAAQRRSIDREQALTMTLSGRSLGHLSQRLLYRGASPSEIVVGREQQQRVRETLEQLPAGDREVLVLRFLEHLSPPEIAAVMGIPAGAVRVRQLRALQRLRKLLGDLGGNLP